MSPFPSDPCPSGCGNYLGIRRDKNRKLYCVCQTCQSQWFIRGQQGIQNLRELLKTIKEHDFEFKQHTRTLYAIQAVLAEMRGIRKEIEALDSPLDLFASDKELKQKERTRKLLNARIETLLSELERIAEQGK